MGGWEREKRRKDVSTLNEKMMSRRELVIGFKILLSGDKEVWCM